MSPRRPEQFRQQKKTIRRESRGPRVVSKEDGKRKNNAVPRCRARSKSKKKPRRRTDYFQTPILTQEKKGARKNSGHLDHRRLLLLTRWNRNELVQLGSFLNRQMSAAGNTMMETTNLKGLDLKWKDHAESRSFGISAERELATQPRARRRMSEKVAEKNWWKPRRKVREIERRPIEIPKTSR